MNFLSHFYFDRDTDNCYLILGTVLPDLLKNADKNIIIHPEKLQHPDAKVNAIIKGWNKHLEVDRYFHSSEFFLTHSHQLKLLLRPAIEGSPVKPFFLGHIALELILDNLLLTTHKITAGSFYDHLDGCEAPVVNEFLTFAGLKDTTVFFKFYEGFKKSRYLFSYAETPQIAYALKRICMRVWKDPFTPEQERQMTEVLMRYRESLFDDFTSIFDEIDNKLMNGDDDKPSPGETKEQLFVNGDRSFIPLPERHGCVSAWLIFALVANSITALIYLFAANSSIQIPKFSFLTLYTFVALLVLNLIFIAKLLRWKRIGFYGICATTLVAFLINICVGISPIACILGLAGLPILYGILQIKKGGTSAWENLK
jgi:hypothetical protein